MFSKQTRYAMIAMCRLAKEYGKEAISTVQLSEEEHIPQRFLENTLKTLKNKGLLCSIRGKTGGYALASPPETIKLSQIVMAFENSLSLVACAHDNDGACDFCKDEKTCKLRRTFRYIHDASFAILNNTTLNDLI